MAKAAKLPKNNFDRAFEAMKDQLVNLLDSHRLRIKQALEDRDGLKGVTVALSGRIAPKDEDTNDLNVKTRINFVPEKVTDSLEEDITNQQDMFEEGPAAAQSSETQAKSASEVLGVGK